MGGTQMANREAFLDRLADKFGRSRAHTVEKPSWQRHPWDHLHQGLSQKDLVDQFEERLQGLGGEVVRVASQDDLATAINSWVTKSKVNRIVSWNYESSIGKILHDTLQQLPKDILETQHVHDSNHPSETQVTFWDTQADADQLTVAAEQADVGFTVAEYGLSETGTVVLYNREDCGRLVSLLPSISATVLSATNVIPRLTQLLPQMKENVIDYSCINLITGPSRSADIEMDLSIGVHGPGQLVVFLIEDHIES
jgi:L-lactate dehydrogenase complex protein LldG